LRRALNAFSPYCLQSQYSFSSVRVWRGGLMEVWYAASAGAVVAKVVVDAWVINRLVIENFFKKYFSESALRHSTCSWPSTLCEWWTYISKHKPDCELLE